MGEARWAYRRTSRGVTAAAGVAVDVLGPDFSPVRGLEVLNIICDRTMSTLFLMPAEQSY